MVQGRTAVNHGIRGSAWCRSAAFTAGLFTYSQTPSRSDVLRCVLSQLRKVFDLDRPVVIRPVELQWRFVFRKNTVYPFLSGHFPGAVQLFAWPVSYSRTGAL